jgi:hypothetical protein
VEHHPSVIRGEGPQGPQAVAAAHGIPGGPDEVLFEKRLLRLARAAGVLVIGQCRDREKNTGAAGTLQPSGKLKLVELYLEVDLVG